MSALEDSLLKVVEPMCEAPMTLEGIRTTIREGLKGASVYVLTHDLDYEGSDTQGVFLTLDAAKAEADEDHEHLKYAERMKHIGREVADWKVNDLGVIWTRPTRYGHFTITEWEIES